MGDSTEGDGEVRTSALLVRDLLFGAGLAALTIALVVAYAGAEPFATFRPAEASVYLGLGLVPVAGWCFLAYRAVVRLIRDAGAAIANVAVMVAALIGLWVSTWCPWGYIEDLARLEPGWRSGPPAATRE